MTRADTLRPLVAAAQAGSLGLLTVVLQDPTGYGRIVREHGRVVRIVEHKDATDAERDIREANTGILAAPTAELVEWLGKLENHNAQGEYYLTDIIALAVADGVEVLASHPGDEWEVLGVNSKAQLAELERVYQQNVARELLDNGVTLADPARIDVRGDLRCGRDVSIDVGCVFEGRVDIGDNVSIGPYCVLKDVSVAPGTRIEAFSHLVGADIGEDSGRFTNKTVSNDSGMIKPDTSLAVKQYDTTRYIIPDSLKANFSENEVGLFMSYDKTEWNLIDSRTINQNKNFTGVILGIDSTKEDFKGATIIIIMDDPVNSKYNKNTYKNIFLMDDSTVIAYATDQIKLSGKKLEFKYYLFTAPTGQKNIQITAEFLNEAVVEKYKKVVDAIISHNIRPR